MMCHVDAIVNPANNKRMHGGGLAAAIVRAGGDVIQQESTDWIRGRSLAIGSAMMTSAGDLPCKMVIHTVGPDVRNRQWGLPTSHDTTMLRKAVRSALDLADKFKLTSIALPGISSGIFRYPRDAAAREIVAECQQFCTERRKTTRLRRIWLLNNDEPTTESFVQALAESRATAGGRVELASEGRWTKPQTNSSVSRPPPLSTTMEARGPFANAMTAWVAGTTATHLPAPPSPPLSTISTTAGSDGSKKRKKDDILHDPGHRVPLGSVGTNASGIWDWAQPAPARRRRWRLPKSPNRL